MTEPAPACVHDEGCITCGDVAVAMRVLKVDEARGLALCADAGDRRETVEVALVAPVAEGDELLVHAGTAIGGPTQSDRSLRPEAEALHQGAGPEDPRRYP